MKQTVCKVNTHKETTNTLTRIPDLPPLLLRVYYDISKVAVESD